MLHPDFFTRRWVVDDRKREFFGLAQNFYRLQRDLYLACWHVFVGLSLRSGDHLAGDFDTVLMMERFDIAAFEYILMRRDLRDAISISERQKSESSHISNIIQPPRQRN